MQSILQAYLQQPHYTYESYRALIDSLNAEGKTTGNNPAYQTPEILEYAKLNIARMNRIDKTVTLQPAVVQALRQIATPQVWLLLTEGWCGDAAQIVPVIHAMAKENPLIDLRLFLRDENLDLMDAYLQDGKSRSIPKLIATTPQGYEIFNWGPRPVAAQTLYSDLKSSGVTFATLAEQLHGWYAKDKTLSTQQELLALLTASVV
ncbi:MAG: thioredoxin family protein [Chitinophagaceae bacterium]